MQSGLIIFLPTHANAMLPWWHIEDGIIVARGEGRLGTETDALPVAATEVPVMALVRSPNVTVRWLKLEELAPKQAEAAARLQIATESLGAGEHLHAVARHLGDDQVMVASLSAELMQFGLDLLATHGFDPDIIIPTGLLFEEPDSGFAMASFGDDVVLRGPQLVMPDEPALRSLLVGDAPISQIDNEQADHALIAAMTAPAINLRSGPFAKRDRSRSISPRQWRILGALTGAAILLSLFLALATYWKYDRAIARENAEALAAAQKLDPSIKDIDSAQARLESELRKRGASSQQYTIAASTLFSVIKESQNVSLRDMRYSTDGTTGATLAAPTIDNINAALIALQQKGYKITATPRQDNSGAALAEITLRAP